MQCPICGFENMPGLDVCARCRTRLTVSGKPATQDVLPPRAGTLKFLRPIGYAINRLIDPYRPARPEPRAPFFALPPLLPRESVHAIAWSLLPGLGHVVDGRRWRGLVAFSAWGVLAALTCCFYPGMLGGVLFSVLMSWHVAVALDAGRVQERGETRRNRVRVLLFVLTIVSLSYFFLDRLIRRFVDFVECPFGIEALYVKAGDTLLVRPGSYNAENLSRGDLVIVGRRTGAVGETVFAVRQVHVTRVLAMPGDVVDVSDQGLFVNGSPISPDQIPDQDLPLPKEPLSITVPEKTVFAMVPVGRIRGRPGTVMGLGGRDAASLIWKNLFLVPVAHIQGRATGIYLPLSRRGSFKRVSTL